MNSVYVNIAWNHQRWMQKARMVEGGKSERMEKRRDCVNCTFFCVVVHKMEIAWRDTHTYRPNIEYTRTLNVILLSKLNLEIHCEISFQFIYLFINSIHLSMERIHIIVKHKSSKNTTVKRNLKCYFQNIRK